MVDASPLPLSVFIIARNEADRIGRTLRAARGLSDDIVVVDSHSTDGTQQVAAAEGARVVENSFAGYGPQKRFAEDLCRHTWLLNIDADEVIPPISRGKSAPCSPAANLRAMPTASASPRSSREKAPHPFAYALAPVRLYRKDRGRYSASTVHDRVDLQPGARVGKLKGTIHHFSVRSLGHQMDKLNAYTDAQVADLEKRGETISAARLVLEFPANFIKAYIGRRHALRGVYGFMTAMNFAFYRYLRAAKYFENRIRREAGEDGPT